ncbi:MAG: DUF481 domain-containing protein [Phycisphaerales bacterium]
MGRINRVLGLGLMLGVGTVAWGVETPIRLSTGEVMQVDVIEANAETIKFVHPVLGEMTVARSAVEILDAEAGDAVAAMERAAEEPEPPAEEAPKSPWKTKITAGGALTDGNSETASIHAGVVVTRETERMATKFDAAYFYAENGGERSENRFTAGVQNDWLNPGSKWFYFARARFDSDEFQSWDTRVSAHGGIGYRLFEDDPFKLNLRAGAGATKEFGSDNDEIRPEALLGLDGSWKISEKSSLVFDSTIYPDLKNTGEYRTLSNAGYSILLDEKTNLSLTAGLQHEYQSEVDSGREHSDVRLFAGLALEF